MKGCAQMNLVYGWEDFGIKLGTIYLSNRTAPAPTELYQGSLFSNILLHFIWTPPSPPPPPTTKKKKKKTMALCSSSSLDFDSR